MAVQQNTTQATGYQDYNNDGTINILDMLVAAQLPDWDPSIWLPEMQHGEGIPDQNNMGTGGIVLPMPSVTQNPGWAGFTSPYVDSGYATTFNLNPQGPAWSSGAQPSWHAPYGAAPTIDWGSWDTGTVMTQSPWVSTGVSEGYFPGAKPEYWSAGSSALDPSKVPSGVIGKFNPAQALTDPFPFEGGAAGEIFKPEFLTGYVPAGAGRGQQAAETYAAALPGFKQWFQSETGGSVNQLFQDAFSGPGGVEQIVKEYYGGVGDLASKPWGEYGDIIPGAEADEGYLGNLAGQSEAGGMLGDYLEKYAGWKDVNLMDPYTDPFGEATDTAIDQANVGSAVKDFVTARKAAKKKWFGQQDPYVQAGSELGSYADLQRLSGQGDTPITDQEILGADWGAYDDSSSVLGTFANMAKDAKHMQEMEPDVIDYYDPSLATTETTTPITTAQKGLIESVYGPGGTYADPTGGYASQIGYQGGAQPMEEARWFYQAPGEGIQAQAAAESEASTLTAQAQAALQGAEQGASQSLFGVSGVTASQLQESGIIDSTGSLTVDPTTFGPGNEDYEKLLNIQSQAGGDPGSGTLGAFALGMDQAESQQGETLQTISDKLSDDVRAAGQGAAGTEQAIREKEAQSSGLILGSAKRSKEVLKKELQDAVESGFKDKAKGKLLATETYDQAIDSATQQFANAIGDTYGAGGNLAQAQISYDQAMSEVDQIRNTARNDMLLDKAKIFGQGATPGEDMDWTTTDDNTYYDPNTGDWEVGMPSGVSFEGDEYGVLPGGLTEYAKTQGQGDYWNAVRAYTEKVQQDLGGPGGVAKYDEYMQTSDTKWKELEDDLLNAKHNTAAAVSNARSVISDNLADLEPGGGEYEAYRQLLGEAGPDLIPGTPGAAGALAEEEALAKEYATRFGAPVYGTGTGLGYAAAGGPGWGLQEALEYPFRELQGTIDQYIQGYLPSTPELEGWSRDVDYTYSDFTYGGGEDSCPTHFDRFEWRNNSCIDVVTNEALTTGYYIAPSGDTAGETPANCCTYDIQGRVQNEPCVDC